MNQITPRSVGGIVTIGPGARQDGEANANAALIAKAPDLLAQVASLQAALSDACLVNDSLKARLDASLQAYALLASHRDRLAETLAAIVSAFDADPDGRLGMAVVNDARKTLRGAQ